MVVGDKGYSKYLEEQDPQSQLAMWLNRQVGSRWFLREGEVGESVDSLSVPVQ